MIAFSKLGAYGRLGNQLFQYAYLRTMAEKLQTTFYCPSWEGDALFDLGDSELRASQPQGIVRSLPPPKQAGYTTESLRVADGSDIEGFFQSEKYFVSRQAVLNWYSFKQQVKEKASSHVPGVDLRNCVSLSLRLDDDYAYIREYFPLYPVEFYQRALRRLQPFDRLIVFADRPDRARQFLADVKGEKTFVEGAHPHHQLYLMTQCRDNVITNSTFAWWGAWLNNGANRKIIVPSHWCRPGVPNPIEDIIPSDWLRVRGTRFVLDNFLVWKLTHPAATLERLRGKIRKKFAGA